MCVHVFTIIAIYYIDLSTYDIITYTYLPMTYLHGVILVLYIDKLYLNFETWYFDKND